MKKLPEPFIHLWSKINTKPITIWHSIDKRFTTFLNFTQGLSNFRLKHPQSSIVAMKSGVLVYNVGKHSINNYQKQIT